LEFFADSREGPKVRVEDKIVQLYKNVPRTVEAALQQQQDATAAAVDHQGFLQEL
jgi:hypothetical protein